MHDSDQAEFPIPVWALPFLWFSASIGQIVSLHCFGRQLSDVLLQFEGWCASMQSEAPICEAQTPVPERWAVFYHLAVHIATFGTAYNEYRPLICSWLTLISSKTPGNFSIWALESIPLPNSNQSSFGSYLVVKLCAYSWYILWNVTSESNSAFACHLWIE